MIAGDLSASLSKARALERGLCMLWNRHHVEAVL